MRRFVVFASSLLLVLGLAACADRNNNGIADSREDDCRPPYACGAFYAGYVPMYYQMHPYSLYMTPYAPMYSFSYSHGRAVPRRTTTRPFTATNVRIAAPKSPVYTKPKVQTNTGSNTQQKAKTGNTTNTAPKTTTVKPKTSSGFSSSGSKRK